MTTKKRGWAALAAAALALTGCVLHDALFGFKPPTISVTGSAPGEMSYREGSGGLVIITGRVNDMADVDFILDTGAPVTVLIDGAQTTALMNKPLMLVAGGSSAIPMPTTGDVKMACYANGVREELRGPAVDLRMGAIAARVAEPTYAVRENTASVQRNGAFGVDAFKGRRMFIDYPGKRLGVAG